MIFNIHAGHAPSGKSACGAVGILNESVEDRKVKNALIAYLKAAGHTVYDCTVDEGSLTQNGVLKKICAKCNTHKVDLDVSIHFNSGAKDAKGNGKTTGVEAYIKAGSAVYKTAIRICDEVAKLGFKNRGVKTKSLYFINHTKSPAILIECCFVDDMDDARLYDADKMARAIFTAITGEKAKTTSNGLDYSLVFDAKYYAKKYPDLAKAGITTEQALFNHFLTYGMSNNEHRQGCEDFNPIIYAAYNKDVVDAYKGNWKDLYIHYILHGHLENRVHK